MPTASARKPAHAITAPLSKVSVSKAHLKAVQTQPDDPVQWWREKQPDYIVELAGPHISREPRYNFFV